MAEFRGLSVKVPIKFSEKAQKELYETCVAYKELAEVRGVENDKLRELVSDYAAMTQYLLMRQPMLFPDKANELQELDEKRREMGIEVDE